MRNIQTDSSINHMYLNDYTRDVKVFFDYYSAFHYYFHQLLSHLSFINTSEMGIINKTIYLIYRTCCIRCITTYMYEVYAVAYVSNLKLEFQIE